MPDDAQTPNTSLPAGLSPVSSEPPASPNASQGGPTPSSPGGPTSPPDTGLGGPAVPSTPPPSIQSQTPPPSNLPAGEAGAAGTFDVPPPAVDVSADLSSVASAKADPSALAGLATSLSETPPTPVIPPAETIPSSQVVPAEPEPKKKSRKTSAIIGGLFLLIVLPVTAYYVVQKTNIMSNLPFASQLTREAEQYRKETACVGGGYGCYQSHPAAAVVTAAPTAVPTATATPTETPTSTPTGIPTGTPVPTSPPPAPGVCDASCGVDSDCSSGFVCATVQGIKRCRKPECTDQFTCVCPAVTATPIPTVVQQVQQIVVTATPTPEPTIIAAAPTPKVPVSGVPSVLGAATVGGGILLLLLGLLL